MKLIIKELKRLFHFEMMFQAKHNNESTITENYEFNRCTLN